MMALDRRQLHRCNECAIGQTLIFVFERMTLDSLIPIDQLACTRQAFLISPGTNFQDWGHMDEWNAIMNVSLSGLLSSWQ